MRDATGVGAPPADAAARGAEDGAATGPRGAAVSATGRGGPGAPVADSGDERRCRPAATGAGSKGAESPENAGGGGQRVPRTP